MHSEQLKWHKFPLRDNDHWRAHGHSHGHAQVNYIDKQDEDVFGSIDIQPGKEDKFKLVIGSCAQVLFLRILTNLIGFYYPRNDCVLSQLFKLILLTYIYHPFNNCFE